MGIPEPFNSTPSADPASVTAEETPYGVRIDSGGHALRGDEPVSHGGGDTGPTPFGLLLSGLGACTAITLRMYAERKQWPLTGVDVELSYLAPDRSTRWINRTITLHGPVDDEQRAKLAEIAEKTPSPGRCAPEPRSAPPSRRTEHGVSARYGNGRPAHRHRATRGTHDDRSGSRRTERGAARPAAVRVCDLRVPSCPVHRPAGAQRVACRARRRWHRRAHRRSRIRIVLRYAVRRGRRPRGAGPSGRGAAQRAPRTVAADRSCGGGARRPRRGRGAALCAGRRHPPHKHRGRAYRATSPCSSCTPGRPDRAGPRGRPGVRRRPPPQIVRRARWGRPRRQRTAPRTPRHRTHRRLGRALLPHHARAAPLEPPGGVVVTDAGTGRYTQRITAGRHLLTADEPVSIGGADAGPNPYELLLAALGACKSMTMRMYADRQGLPLHRTTVRLHHDRVHAKDCEECEQQAGMLSRIRSEIDIEGPLGDQDRRRLLEIADRCPVHRTLNSEIIFEATEA